MGVKCVKCNSDMVISYYNYDTGLLNYECKECNHNFTEKAIKYCDMCGEQIIDDVVETDDMVFCSKECSNKFNN